MDLYSSAKSLKTSNVLVLMFGDYKNSITCKILIPIYEFLLENSISRERLSNNWENKNEKFVICEDCQKNFGVFVCACWGSGCIWDVST